MKTIALLFLLASALCPLAHAEDTQGIVIPFKQVSVASPSVLQEIIDAMLVEEGVTVKEGQIIAKLRDEKELKEKMGSKDQWLKAQTELDLARLQHQLAVVRFDEKSIRSPLSGIVVKKYKESGESVDRSEKLVDIVNIDEVFVQFYLDPKLMALLKTEMQVRVKFPVIGNKEFSGTISFIDPRIDAGSNLFRVKVLVENKDQTIKAGMRGMADFAKVAGVK
jgi:multidrug efflux pump subunit AcrA (membrane-fusion protein)